MTTRRQGGGGLFAGSGCLWFPPVLSLAWPLIAFADYHCPDLHPNCSGRLTTAGWIAEAGWVVFLVAALVTAGLVARSRRNTKARSREEDHR